MYVIKTHQIIMMVAFFLSFHRFGTTCHFMSAFFLSQHFFYLSVCQLSFLRQSFVGFCHYTCILYEYTVSMHPFTNFSESFVFLITIFLCSPISSNSYFFSDSFPSHSFFHFFRTISRWVSSFFYQFMFIMILFI